MKQLFSAGVVIFRMRDSNREYLLLHYPHGHWDLPKGKIEKGESNRQAALRELKEETGLDATILDGFECKISYFFDHEEKLAMKNVVFFVGQAAETDSVTLSDEHINYAWLNYDEAMERLTFENAKEVVKKVSDFFVKRGM